MTVPSISREYVWVPVTATGDDAAQLLTLPVEMAFMPTRTAEPITGDWHSAEWADTPTPYARCLIGPDGGGVPLTNGPWWVWLRVTGATERPARNTGRINIT